MAQVSHTGMPAFVREGWSGWMNETWDVGISAIISFNGVGFDIIPAQDTQLLIVNSGPLAGALIRLMGVNLSPSGNSGSNQALSFAGFRIHDL